MKKVKYKQSHTTTLNKYFWKNTKILNYPKTKSIQLIKWDYDQIILY